MTVEGTLIEVVAEQQHAIWAHWMKYLFSVCAEADDGSMLIPNEKVERWQRQMWTPYADLTNAEQETDRHQALKVLPALNNIILALTDATERAEQAEAALAQCQAWRQEEADNLNHCIRAKQKAESRAADRASEAAACHDIMAECRNIAGEPHNSTADAVRGLLARAEKAEAALAKARLDYLRVQQESAGYCADAEEAIQILNEWQAEVRSVPVDYIRRAMADTTAQHYSWYEPIRRWLDSLDVKP